jgi:hypothetical protein
MTYVDFAAYAAGGDEKFIHLRELCVSNEQSEWAVKKGSMV